MHPLLKICFAFLLVTFSFPASGYAKPLKMVFFYPGGQGSQQQAKPLLDEFSAALKKASGGKIESEILYISDAATGESYIREQKPDAGILSLDVYLKNATTWDAKAIARSLQLPSADGKNQYFLVGRSGSILPEDTIHVYSSLPLDKSFVEQTLFPKLNRPVTLEVTANILGKLRKIGQGGDTRPVLLDQYEYATISRLKTPWAKNLTALAASENGKRAAAQHKVAPTHHPALWVMPQMMCEHIQGSIPVFGQYIPGARNVFGNSGCRTGGYREVRNGAGPRAIGQFRKVRLPVLLPKMLVAAERYALLELGNTAYAGEVVIAAKSSCTGVTNEPEQEPFLFGNGVLDR